MITEYEGSSKVFFIDDGERHWYVALDSESAMDAHEQLMDPDRGWRRDATCTQRPPAEELSCHFDDERDMVEFPAHWPRSTAHGSWKYRVTATTAEWAKFMDASCPQQICSSVF